MGVDSCGNAYFKCQCEAGPKALQPSRCSIDKCIEKLKENPAYACVVKLVEQQKLSKADLASCGCIFLRVGDDLPSGKRNIYKCEGVLPGFYVSEFKGTTGILPIDAAGFTDCMFDIAKGPNGAGPVYNQPVGNQCFECHSRESPVID